MLRVLLVDDKPVFLIKMKRMKLWDDGVFSIAGTASNGKEALDLLHASNIDIVITDIKMPVMDGLELLKICKTENLCNCMILMSSYDDFEYARSALINGAFDYILKPLNEENVKDVLNRYIQTLSDNQLTQRDIREIAFYLKNRDYKKIFELTENYMVYDKDNMYMQLKDILKEYKKENPDIGNYITVDQLIHDSGVLKTSDCSQVILNDILRFLTEYIDKLCPQTNSPVILQIIRYTLKNIENNIHISDIADELFMNKQYLSSLFYKETSIHLFGYIRWLKIARAKCLIEYHRVYEIADKLGFKDVEYFSRIFLDYTGCTPRNYGKRISAIKCFSCTKS